MFKDDDREEGADGGLSYAAIAYALLSVLATGVGLLLWQVWINTGRLDRLETRADNHEKEMVRIDKIMERSDDKRENEFLRLQSRVDQLTSICEELRAKKSRFPEIR